MSAPAVTCAISQAQTELDGCAEDESVQEGAYVKLSNSLKEIKEKWDDGIDEAKREMYADLALYNPDILGTPTPHIHPLDMDLAAMIFSRANSNEVTTIDTVWWFIVMNSYRDIIFEYTTGIFCKHRRMTAFRDLIHLCDCKMETQLCKTLKDSNTCFICHFQEDIGDDEGELDEFVVDVLCETPRLIINLHECPGKSQHKIDYDMSIAVARKHACECHWGDIAFQQVVGKRPRKRRNGKRVV